jgi:hypothetical protein
MNIGHTIKIVVELTKIVNVIMLPAKIVVGSVRPNLDFLPVIYIQGLFCHETGCLNQHKVWNSEEGIWDDEQSIDEDDQSSQCELLPIDNSR